MKLPRAIRFFRKPDHISFLVGYILFLPVIATDIFELKVASFLLFSFTLVYEIFEISKGGRDIYKLDHFTFIFGYALIILSFVYPDFLILITVVSLMTFTLLYEIYRVRKLDLENMRKKSD